MKTKRNPSGVHAPFSTYAHQIELNSEGRLLALSGQIGADTDGNIVPGVARQIELAWHNVGVNLKAADMDYDDLVKVVVYLVADSIDTNERRQVFKRVFSSVTPCMTVLYVSALGDPSMKVELDVWASAEAYPS